MRQIVRNISANGLYSIYSIKHIPDQHNRQCHQRVLALFSVSIRTIVWQLMGKCLPVRCPAMCVWWKVHLHRHRRQPLVWRWIAAMSRTWLVVSPVDRQRVRLTSHRECALQRSLWDLMGWIDWEDLEHVGNDFIGFSGIVRRCYLCRMRTKCIPAAPETIHIPGV